MVLGKCQAGRGVGGGGEREGEGEDNNPRPSQPLFAFSVDSSGQISDAVDASSIM